MKIIAHRGASQYAPENTIAAFKKAIELNADAIELDVRLSKDHIPVLSHDATINRQSNKKGYVHNYTLSQLKKFDFGSKFSNDFKKEPIATLEEVFQLVQKTNIKLHIELKNDPTLNPLLEEKVLDLVYAYHMEHRVFYSNFDHTSLEKLYKMDNTARVGLLFFGNIIQPFQYIDRLDFTIYSVHPNHFYVNEETMKEAQKRQLEINVYTVNQPDDALTYKNLGVNGLITNDPLIFE